LQNLLKGIPAFKTPVEEDDIKALGYFWSAANLQATVSARSSVRVPAMEP